MNKHTLSTLAIFAVSLTACNKTEKMLPEPQAEIQAAQPEVDFESMYRYSGSDYSQPIHKDTANVMIQSYQASNASTNLRSLTFSAAEMRSYLDRDSIATLKFFFAHKLSHISNNSYGNFGGVSSSSLTILMAALNENDNYTYGGDYTAYDLTSGQKVSRDTANYMISSYLSSVGHPNNTTLLQSLTFDADTMRSYLNNQSITQLKLVMAHDHTYYPNNYGNNAGNLASALTFVIIGYNSMGSPVYYKQNMVMDHFQKCPTHCPSSATLTL